MPIGFTVDADGSASAHRAPPAPPRGWYRDPDDSEFWRFWSGSGWTTLVHPRDPSHTAAYLPEGGVEPSTPARLTGSENATRDDLRSRVPAQSLIEKLVELERRGERAEQDSWYRGAVGEQYVAGLLSTLGPEWTVLHSVPVGTDGSDIDHVLIGPPGVFTINTKHHPGKKVWVASRAIRVNNQPKHYLTNAAHEAGRAQRLLSKATGFTVEVVGIIVVVGASLTIRERPHSDGAQIGVVEASDLLRSVQVRREYSDEQVAKIADAAVRPQTWSPLAPKAAADRAALLAQFDAIDARMRAGAKAPRPARTAPRSRPHSPRGRPVRKRNGWLKLAQFAVTTAVIVGAMLIGPHLVTSFFRGMTTSMLEQQAERLDEAKRAEYTTLAQAAGTAAFVLDANSPGGIRPAKLAITPGDSRLVIADTDIVLVDLPDGTTGSYTVTPDGRSYTLTLVGPRYGTTVTFAPESGVVAG